MPTTKILIDEVLSLPVEERAIKDGVDEILNLQPKDGKGRPYQVKQVRDVILKYHIRIGE